MKNRYLLLLAAATAFACSKETPSAEQAAQKQPSSEADLHDRFAKVEVDEVDKLLTAKKAVPVDANNADTRKEFGTLPGAVLLTNSREFEMGELPGDKSTELIFYCGSEKCMAAPRAAARAEEAGYASVKVMPAGIRGWVGAGKPTDQS